MHMHRAPAESGYSPMARHASAPAAPPPKKAYAEPHTASFSALTDTAGGVIMNMNSRKTSNASRRGAGVSYRPRRGFGQTASSESQPTLARILTQTNTRDGVSGESVRVGDQ